MSLNLSGTKTQYNNHSYTSNYYKIKSGHEFKRNKPKTFFYREVVNKDTASIAANKMYSKSEAQKFVVNETLACKSYQPDYKKIETDFVNAHFQSIFSNQNEEELSQPNIHELTNSLNGMVDLSKKEKPLERRAIPIRYFNDKIYSIFVSSECPYVKQTQCLIVLKEIEEAGLKPDKFSFTPMLDIWTRLENEVQALKVLRMMKEADIEPGVLTYMSLIRMYYQLGNTNAMEVLFKEMESAGVAPDLRIFNMMLMGFVKESNTKKFNEYLKLMEVRNIHQNKVTNDVRIQQLADSGNMKDARLVLAENYPNRCPGNELIVIEMTVEVALIALHFFLETWNGSPFDIVTGKRTNMAVHFEFRDNLKEKIEEKYSHLKCSIPSNLGRLHIERS